MGCYRCCSIFNDISIGKNNWRGDRSVSDHVFALFWWIIDIIDFIKYVQFKFERLSTRQNLYALFKGRCWWRQWRCSDLCSGEYAYRGRNSHRFAGWDINSYSCCHLPPSGLQIPAKACDYEDWISTDPTEFKQELVNANQTYGNQITLLVRVVKYWNALSGYPFESYSLEQNIVQHGFSLLCGRQLKDYFYGYIEGMDAGLFAPKWKQEAVSRARQLTEEAKSQECQGYTASAEATIKKLLSISDGLVFGNAHTDNQSLADKLYPTMKKSQ